MIRETSCAARGIRLPASFRRQTSSQAAFRSTFLAAQAALPTQQIDYINVSLYDHGSGTSEAADFSAEGPWGELPAGPLRWAFGAEYRDEGGSFHLDPLRKAGVTGEETPLDLQGVSFDSRSVYLEGRAPLLRDRLAARTLDLSVGVRYSEFSSFGGDTTWQSGLRWQPVESWSLRANYAEVFRAPALDELYRNADTRTASWQRLILAATTRHRNSRSIARRTACQGAPTSRIQASSGTS